MKTIPDLIKILKCCFFAGLLCAHGARASESPLAHTMVSAAAEAFVNEQLKVAEGTRVSIRAHPLDKRLKVPFCPLPLQATSNNGTLGQANVTVRVSCPSNQWFIYTVVKVHEVQTVVVPNSAMSPGSVLTDANLDVIEVDKRRLRGTTFDSKEQLLGARLKRRSRPGQPISPSMLCFVCKGDSIVIIAELTGMTIKTTGIAQQDGNIGDTILVKNRRSKKRIDAKVVSVNRVMVHI